MNWDQIENNWAAMTRRVRPERTVAVLSGTATPQASSDVAEASVDGPERTVAQEKSASRQIA